MLVMLYKSTLSFLQFMVLSDQERVNEDRHMSKEQVIFKLVARIIIYYLLDNLDITFLKCTFYCSNISVRNTHEQYTNQLKLHFTITAYYSLADQGILGLGSKFYTQCLHL